MHKMNWGSMTYKMTGEYENQRRFAQTMQIVFPAVMLIIFVMLYLVYHSAAEAAHVLLAVPFALSGGVAVTPSRNAGSDCVANRSVKLKITKPSAPSSRLNWTCPASCSGPESLCAPIPA